MLNGLFFIVGVSVTLVVSRRRDEVENNAFCRCRGAIHAEAAQETGVEVMEAYRVQTGFIVRMMEWASARSDARLVFD